MEPWHSNLSIAKLQIRCAFLGTLQALSTGLDLGLGFGTGLMVDNLRLILRHFHMLLKNKIAPVHLGHVRLFLCCAHDTGA